MAYVRRRGNQLAIVAGERNPESRQVEQRVLFTLHSKAEALEMLGRGTDKENAFRFESLMKHAHPKVAFDWKQIRRAVAADLNHLPDEYAYKEARLTGRFKQSLVEFARDLMLADPQNLVAAGTLIRENRLALEYLSELIAWRLKTSGEREENEWNRDNAFFWRFAIQDRSVPPEIEEHGAGFWEKRDLPRAEGAFRLMLDAFPTYAEGWNYLGLIALERGDLERAEESFRCCIEVGRKLFPKRIARSAYWSNHDTRPYMRGLRNLALALSRARRYPEALEIADRLESECADEAAAKTYRASIALDTGDWKLAAASAHYLRGLWPEYGLIEAFARFELGERSAARESFLHAAFTHPCATRIVLRLPGRQPKTSTEAEDHNAGVHFLASLGHYLKKARASKAFFIGLMSDPAVAKHVRRVEELRDQWFGHPKADKSIFDEYMTTQHSDFAAHVARRLEGVTGLAGPPRGLKAGSAGTARDRRAGRAGHARMH